LTRKRQQQFGFSQSPNKRRRYSSLGSDKHTSAASDSNGESDELDSDEDYDDNDEPTETDVESDEPGREDGEKRDLLSELMAQLSSDDEEANVDSPKASDESKENNSQHDDDDDDDDDEINPFCMDLTAQDPWADCQQTVDEKTFSSTSNGITSVGVEKKLAEKGAMHKRLKRAKRKVERQRNKERPSELSVSWLGKNALFTKERFHNFRQSVSHREFQHFRTNREVIKFHLRLSEHKRGRVHPLHQHHRLPRRRRRRLGESDRDQDRFVGRD
jgi:hypothetical protein